MLTPDTLTGPAIVTRYLGPTDHRPSRVVATHKRDSARTIRATVEWHHAIDAEANHRAAAEACLARCGFSQPMTIVARGHDEATYTWIAVGLWQLEPAALALAACRELAAAAAGGASAEALALPLALARQALGVAPVRPTVDGFRVGPAHPGPVLIDVMGQAIDGLAFPGHLSPAGALAAAAAAGWPLTAAAAHTASRLQGEPDPAAVAQALSVLGGCPAVIVTLAPDRGLLSPAAPAAQGVTP